MICKKCGFEYVDGLKECPNCQEPNIPIETQVLTDNERDTFEGVTIEEAPSSSGEEFKVYDPGDNSYEDDSEDNGFTGVHVKRFSMGTLLWEIIFILLVIGFIFFALPVMIGVTVICGLAYYLYRWLFE